MLLLLSNCDCHFPFLPFKPLLKPYLQIHCPRFANLQVKPFRRRASIYSNADHADPGASSQFAIRRIAEKLRSLGYVDESSKDTTDGTSIAGPNSPGEIFVPLPTRLPKYRVGHTMDPSWSTPENSVPVPGSGNAIQRYHELRRGVMGEEEKERIRQRDEGKRQSAPSMAELTLLKEELGRLRSEGIQLKKKLKVGKAGITEGIVNGIHERWRRSEMVKITCEDISRLNMKRTHDLLERKTGGLVVWRSGGNIILYRGPHYKYPYFQDKSLLKGSSSISSAMDEDPTILNETVPSSPVTTAVESSGVDSDRQFSHPPLVQGVGFPHRVRFQLPGEVDLAKDANALLEGLGPRFKDWWGYDPLPVDADLLPAVVPGYKRPFRLLPFGVKAKLTNDELNTLRRLGRPLPCHFALGRNRGHQGLAASIINLWEKCEIAKIALKRGVQNTNSELIAEELKRLTGGMLLSRDKEFIFLYRGKDFLPTAVSSAIEDRRKYGTDVSKISGGRLHLVNQNKDTRLAKEYACETEPDKETNLDLHGVHGEQNLMFSEAAKETTVAKLSTALAKKAKAEKLLEKIEENENPQTSEIDKVGITEEERYMLRRIGLRMKPFLLLGRRGVFDGTVENMHLHWKYRELVKVCIGRRSTEEVHRVARTLEAESGGILVAVEQVNKGYDIIMYRGKNYKRPASLRPRTLLSKREAMKRSLEAQRRESLKLHILKLDRTIDQMKHIMSNGEDIKDVQLANSIESVPIEQGTHENHNNDGEMSQTDPESDCNSSYFDMHANEARENHGTDATSTSLEDPVSTRIDPLHIIHQDLLGDASSPSAVANSYLVDATDADLQGQSIQKETTERLNINEQKKNAVFSHNLRDPTSSPNTAYIQTNPRGKDPVGGGYESASLELPVRQATSEGPRMTALRSLQLSNKERLLLRKQALSMKKRPVLAVGKNNIINGVAKTIKEHFKKHPLAIVNIKGRPKGTSIQEVIYNLEQSTGAVLVSQEPTKVILYRGWGSGAELDEGSGKVNYSSAGREVNMVPAISSELISAIRLECGLKPIGMDSDTIAHDIPYDN